MQNVSSKFVTLQFVTLVWLIKQDTIQIPRFAIQIEITAILIRLHDKHVNTRLTNVSYHSGLNCRDITYITNWLTNEFVYYKLKCTDQRTIQICNYECRVSGCPLCSPRDSCANILKKVVNSGECRCCDFRASIDFLSVKWSIKLHYYCIYY